jgi:hypothetical protein
MRQIESHNPALAGVLPCTFPIFEAKLLKDLTEPAFKQINVQIEALQTLRRTRDLLLPRQQSGKVTLPTN